MSKNAATLSFVMCSRFHERVFRRGLLYGVFGVPENFNFWGGAEAGVAFMPHSGIRCEPLAEGGMSKIAASRCSRRETLSAVLRKNNAKLQKISHLCKFKCILGLYICTLPSVAETIFHELVSAFLVNPPAFFPMGKRVRVDVFVANHLSFPAIQIGIERLVGGVAEGLAVGEESEFLAVRDEQLLQLTEGNFDNFVRYFCHFFCLFSFVFCLLSFLFSPFTFLRFPQIPASRQPKSAHAVGSHRLSRVCLPRATSRQIAAEPSVRSW